MRTFATVLLCIFAITFADDPLKNNNRPPVGKRLFTSPAIEQVLQNIVPKMVDPELALLFVNCLPNTLDTTVYFSNTSDLDTFIITGDIPAMWLRDSSGQVFPYIQFANSDPLLKSMLRGLISRQTRSVLIDPYANAFNRVPSLSPWDGDDRVPPMNVYLWEGKYELDSLSWVLKLSAKYFKSTSDDSICTSTWFNAVSKILQVMHYQQQELEDMSPNDDLFYSFARTTNTQSETLLAHLGAPSKKCGLVRGAFRPSDDAHTFPYQIAGNALASAALKDISDVLSTQGGCFNPSLAFMAKDLSAIIDRAIQGNGIISHPTLGPIYAYEVDGYGSSFFMDDATLPNLLSLPYFDYVSSKDPTYVSTRSKFLLSKNNPWYFCGSLGCGVGSPHTGRGKIWPMAVLIQALTSNDPNEIAQCLNLLKTTTAGLNFMHESFNASNANDFTRPWFAWANSLFGDLILKVAKEYPQLIFGSKH